MADEFGRAARNRNRIDARYDHCANWGKRMSARLIAHRSGYTLLAVLCVIIAVSTLVTSMVRSSSDALLAVTNRVNLMRAGWIAEGCAERARAAIDERLATTEVNDTIWRNVDVVVATSA